MAILKASIDLSNKSIIDIITRNKSAKLNFDIDSDLHKIELEREDILKIINSIGCDPKRSTKDGKWAWHPLVSKCFTGGADGYQWMRYKNNGEKVYERFSDDELVEFFIAFMNGVDDTSYKKIIREKKIKDIIEND